MVELSLLVYVVSSCVFFGSMFRDGGGLVPNLTKPDDVRRYNAINETTQTCSKFRSLPIRFVITTQLESSNRHMVIENRAGQINENSGGSAYTVQDEFAIHLTKTEMGGGHYKMNLF